MQLDKQKINLRLDGADVLGTELGVGILGRDDRGDDNVIARKPVDRGGDALLVGGLQGLHDTQYFGGVAAGRGRVGQGQTDLLAGVDDENGADGEGEA